MIPNYFPTHELRKQWHSEASTWELRVPDELVLSLTATEWSGAGRSLPTKSQE